MKTILPAGTTVDVVIYGADIIKTKISNIKTELSIVIEKYDAFYITENKCHTYRHFNSLSYILYFNKEDLITI